MSTNKVQNLRDAISYQPGQVAHIPVLTSGAGAVLLMAFDKGAKLAEHFTPAMALVQVLEGELKFTVEGTPYTLKEGDYLTLTPGQKHSVEAIEPTRMLLTKLNVLPDRQ